MKKFLAAMLAFAMVVTGLYIVKPAEVKAANDVNKAMLGVEAQLETKGGKEIIRLVSSVDSINYKSAGFDVVYPDGSTKTIYSNTVFKKIVSNTDTEFKLSPNAISAVSEYFVTTKIEAKATGDYTVKAFVLAKDGTKVVGAASSFSVADLKGDTVIVKVPAQLDKSKTYTATYGSNKEGTGATAASVTVLVAEEGNSVVRIGLAGGAKASSLKSVTKFVVAEGSNTYEGIYRNYKTTHVPAEGTTPVADTSWYDVNPEAEEFFLATSADLYGFAAIQNAGTSEDPAFTKLPKVTLISDIVINKGTATENGWTAASGEATYKWAPIGSGSGEGPYYGRYAGTFDGAGNTIEGIVVVEAANFAGLFGATNTGYTIKNFKLLNSYIQGTYDVGIVGMSYGGTLENIYTDAIFKATDASYGFAGSMIGRTAVEESTHTISNCWFNGKVIGSNYIGGMVGRSPVKPATLEFKNCLSTGAVNATVNYAGGFLGEVSQQGSYIFENCFSAATVTTPGTGIGSFAGATTSSNAAFQFKVGNYTIIPEATMEIIAKVGSYTSATNKGHVLTAPEGFYKTLAEIKDTNIADLFGSTDNWAKSTVNEQLIPIPRVFAAWWALKSPIVEDKKPVPEVETCVPDTSWYDASATEFTLTKRAQLYGLAELAKTNDFAGKTIKLGKNIALNDNINVATWKTTAPEGVWTPIGSEAKPFAGTFDGQGYTISGLYLNATTAASGLFGATSATAQLKNFKLVDSYLKSSADYIGIVGKGTIAKVENVYTSATIESTGKFVGGFFGGVATNGATVEFNKCWFDGTINQIQGEGEVLYCAGGFIGQDNGATVIAFTDCLSSGKITGVTKVGGFAGWFNNYAVKTFTNCLSVATVETTNEEWKPYYGQISGQINTSPYNFTLTNTYVVGEKLNGVYRSQDATYQEALESADYVKELSYVTGTAVDTLFGADSNWVAVSGSTPVLKGMK